MMPITSVNKSRESSPQTINSMDSNKKRFVLDLARLDTMRAQIYERIATCSNQGTINRNYRWKPHNKAEEVYENIMDLNECPEDRAECEFSITSSIHQNLRQNKPRPAQNTWQTGARVRNWAVGRNFSEISVSQEEINQFSEIFNTSDLRNQNDINGSFVVRYQGYEKNQLNFSYSWKRSLIKFEIHGRSVRIVQARNLPIININLEDFQIHRKLEKVRFFDKVTVFKSFEQVDRNHLEVKDYEEIEQIWSRGGNSQKQCEQIRRKLLRLFAAIDSYIQNEPQLDSQIARNLKEEIYKLKGYQKLLLENRKELERSDGKQEKRFRKNIEILGVWISGQEKKVEQLMEKRNEERPILSELNSRKERLIETYLKLIPGYISDVIKFGFISEKLVLHENETKINVHYFQRKHVQRLLEIVRGFFKNQYFNDFETQKWTGWILITGSVGNHNNEEPKLLQALENALQRQKMNFVPVGITQQNEGYGHGFLIQFVHPNEHKINYIVKKIKDNEGNVTYKQVPWHSYYTHEEE